MNDKYNDNNFLDENENNMIDAGADKDPHHKYDDTPDDNDNYNDDQYDGNKTEFYHDENSNTDDDLNSWSDEKIYDSDKMYNYNSEKNVYNGPSHYLENKKYKNSGFTAEDVQYVHQPSKNKMDKGLKVFLIVAIMIVGITAMVLGSSILASFLIKKPEFGRLFGGNNGSGDTPVINTVDCTETEGTKTAEEIYVKVAPSIVGVITYNPSAGLVSSAMGQGSGIIMSEDGYVITNAHVIGNSNKYKVTVVTSDRQEYDAKIVGFDTRTDIAVLKVNASGLTAAEFGNSDQLAVGAWVLAIGNPGGLEFSNSLTRGLVSALNRSLGASNSLVKYIQTDAAINPGNSGGALLNMYGQVIGVNSSKVTDYEGMGFAIPMNTVKTVVDDIIKKGYVSGRVKLGITVRALSAYEAQINNAPQGLLVVEVASDSDAYAKGLKPGDIITKFNGADTNTTSALYSELAKHNPGDTANLTIYRLSPVHSGKSTTLDINVTLHEDKGELQ